MLSSRRLPAPMDGPTVKSAKPLLLNFCEKFSSSEPPRAATSLPQGIVTNIHTTVHLLGGAPVTPVGS
jgi:hypothetical protein